MPSMGSGLGAMLAMPREGWGASRQRKGRRRRARRPHAPSLPGRHHCGPVPWSLSPHPEASADPRVCHGTLGTRSAALVHPLPARWTLKTVAGPPEALGPLKP